jgi:putative FmdB family regulatory protein
MIYTYKCPDCHTVQDAQRSVAERNNSPQCACGQTTVKVIGAGNGHITIMGGADMPGYMCPVTETWVDSRKKRREIMKRHDLVEVG